MNRYAFLEPTKQSAKKRVAKKREVLVDGIQRTTKKIFKPSIYPGLEAPALVCLDKGITDREKTIKRILGLGYDYTANPEKADILVWDQGNQFFGFNSQPAHPRKTKSKRFMMVPEHMFFQSR